MVVGGEGDEMTERVLLYANGSGKWGWGHIHRALAVAWELSRRGILALWVTETPAAVRSMGPPCPVAWTGPDPARALTDWGSRYRAERLLADVPEDRATEGVVERALGYPTGIQRAVAVIDRPTDWSTADVRVAPHFGADQWPFPGWGAVCAGPWWVPLAPQFRLPADETRWGRARPLLTYRAPSLGRSEGIVPLPNRRAGVESGGETPLAWWEHSWGAAVVPASTIAYEAMALGIPVLFLEGAEVNPELAEAMIRAGVARRYEPPDATPSAAAAANTTAQMAEAAQRARALVDGGGTERIVDLLMEPI